MNETTTYLKVSEMGVEPETPEKTLKVTELPLQKTEQEQRQERVSANVSAVMANGFPCRCWMDFTTSAVLWQGLLSSNLGTLFANRGRPCYDRPKGESPCARNCCATCDGLRRKNGRF